MNEADFVADFLFLRILLRTLHRKREIALFLSHRVWFSSGAHRDGAICQTVTSFLFKEKTTKNIVRKPETVANSENCPSGGKNDSSFWYIFHFATLVFEMSKVILLCKHIGSAGAWMMRDALRIKKIVNS